MALLDPIPDPRQYSFDPKDYPRPGLYVLQEFRAAMAPLIGVQLPILQIPRHALLAFEPSQIGTITGTLMDACIPQLDKVLPKAELEEMEAHGLSKHEGILGEREGYPDFFHEKSGIRAELKLLYVNPPSEIKMKSPPTPREPSARLTQKVTLKNVEPDRDVLLVLAYQLRLRSDEPELVSPTIIDVGVFPMINCILARDRRLIRGGGKWFGNFETPAILSKRGKAKLAKGQSLDDTTYGRKESEGKDYNEDTNFGKLKRIPDPALKAFLKKHR